MKARGAGCGGTECGGWGAGCDAPLDQLSDLGAAQLVDDGVDLVDEIASAEAREVAELSGREGPCARERRALGRVRREGGGWFGVCSPFSRSFSSADVILPGSVEGVPFLVVTRSSCGCPDTLLRNVSISCVLQGKRHVRGGAYSLAWVVWGNCGGGTSRWSVFAARRKGPKLASSAALRVPPNLSASRNISVKAKAPSHLVRCVACVCSIVGAAPVQHVLCGVMPHQFVQSMEGSVTARIGSRRNSSFSWHSLGCTPTSSRSQPCQSEGRVSRAMHVAPCDRLGSRLELGCTPEPPCASEPAPRWSAARARVP